MSNAQLNAGDTIEADERFARRNTSPQSATEPATQSTDMLRAGFWPMAVRSDNVMLTRPTIFLVDDDAQMRLSLTWLLERNGYDVVGSSSSTDALANYDPSRPGCLILDIQLPEVTGIELYEQLRARGPVHPFIVITAYGRVPIAVEAMRLGAVDFIEKPFQSEQLLSRVKEAVVKDREIRRIDVESQTLVKRLNVLGRREWQVAALVAAGMSSREIGDALRIKLRTVEVHRHNILKKLHADSSAEVAALFTKAKALKDQGIIDFPE